MMQIRLIDADILDLSLSFPPPNGWNKQEGSRSIIDFTI